MKNTQVLLLYVPAYHMGYVNFFEKHKGDVYLIDRLKMFGTMPRLERDIRALPVKTMKTLLYSLYPDRVIRIANDKNIQGVFMKYDTVIMPDEDLSYAVADNYGTDFVNKTKYLPTFLRWDRKISSAEYEVDPNRIVSSAIRDKELIQLASDKAVRSKDWWRQVGAVISRDGEPLLSCYNQPYPDGVYSLDIFGDPRSNYDAGDSIETSKVIHAEAFLIASAAKTGLSLNGVDLYVTTFPCPVCAKSVSAAGIKRVFYSQGYSLLDAEDIFEAAKIEVILVK